jgi:hypothetical protein
MRTRQASCFLLMSYFLLYILIAKLMTKEGEEEEARFEVDIFYELFT